ncbi:ureidoglycolate lyase [Rubellimicrobium sp. CFH 75288]|uniref:ureidoglycolate lyase n=1 Tax=Rubellimicrobium sp. CFH 75288 TaxID=2697034 RepID=UPI0014127723|nr:Ureidoglycolate hydrolase [Rubellimicrobium sp. CFH 75288]
MTRAIAPEPLSAAAFAPFGEVLAAEGPPDRLINRGLCGRWHDRARLEFGTGRAGISLFRAEPRALPLRLEMVERHPLGSQAFLPLDGQPFLVIVAEGEEAVPGRIRAFLTAPGQGVNLRRGCWHGVLTPLHPPGLFAVVDRIAPEDEAAEANLEEYWLPEPVIVG